MEDKLQEWWNDKGFRYFHLFLKAKDWPTFEELIKVQGKIVIEKEHLEYMLLMTQIIVLKDIYGPEVGEWVEAKLKETWGQIQGKIRDN